LEIYADRADHAESDRVAELLKDVPPDKPLVAMATGSANPAKRYPADLMAEVIARLFSNGCAVVLTAGPGETDLAEEILTRLPQRVLLLSEARVPTLAALYRRARLYLGPDSGPKHVAVACGIPTVTLFGPGRPGNWNDPMNARNIVLLAPCDVRPHCIEAECARRQCLRKIPPDDVVRAALALLQ
jgi:ADP-heptose:LPS heptosyltransferase